MKGTHSQHSTTSPASPRRRRVANDAPAAARVADLCAELARILDRRTGSDGGHETAIPALTFWRYSQPTKPMPGLQQPAVYIVVQGRKHVELGGETYVYDPTQYLAVSLEVPVVSRVVQASPDRPYLCMTVRVDARELAALIVETGQAMSDDHDGRALFVSPIDAPLLDALLRLVQLLDRPQDIPILSPLILREFYYRLLQGEQQGRLAEMAIGDGRVRRIAGAILWIKEHFAKPLHVETLAKRVNMSPSALHRHFAAVTGVSPVQYQKRLRLEEARRVLLATGTSAEAVAYEVGYESPSQFSREYARLFGQPPRRDAERLRADAAAVEPAAPKRRTRG
jgi:AraC-like DNA-binding protein